MCCANGLQFCPQSRPASFPPSVERLSGSQGSLPSCWITICRAFVKMVPALCYNSLDEEGNNFITYLHDAMTNSKKI